MKKLKNFATPLAIVLGIISGLSHVPILLVFADMLASVVMKVLQLISVPLIFFSIIAVLSSMESFQKLYSLGKKVFKYTFITTWIAALIAFSLYIFISPQTSVSSVSSGNPSQENFINVFVQLFPTNFIQVFLENNVFGAVLIALVLGMAIVTLPETQKKHLTVFFQAIFQALLKITSFVVTILPIAIWAFVTRFAHDMSVKSFADYKPILLYLAVVVGANLIQAFVVLPLMCLYKKQNPFTLFKGVSQALSVAFFSKSSNASLPITMRSMEENLKIPQKVTSFCLPLCSTINMNACAAFIFTTVSFVSMSYGLQFSVFHLFVGTLIATFAAIGNAGVPMGCYFLSSALLASLGVPLDLLGLILPAYTLIDMLETAINVWSDCCVTTFVHQDLRHAVRHESST